MKLTKHAARRSQQRGVEEDILLLISLFGDIIAKDKGGIKMQMSERARSKIIQLLDKCRRKVVVTDRNYEVIITTYAVSR